MKLLLNAAFEKIFEELDVAYKRGPNPLICYDSGSDESLHRRAPNPFGINQHYSPFGSSERFSYNKQHAYNPNQRRHSSYSHEDILNLKYQQPQIDPRYRDTRPFVSSASNIYEYKESQDLFTRRRSSSSLQDEMIQPFKTFQQKAVRGFSDGVTRKSNPTLTTSGGSLSDKSSKWDVNPSIFIEEYDDTKHSNAAEENRSPSSSTKSLAKPDIELHEPLDEESVAPFVGSEELPFIDDELANQSDESEPIYVPSAMQSHEYVSTRKGAPMIKNRKTVSFDLVEKNYGTADSNLNKSKTCGHITNISFSDINRNLQSSQSSETTKLHIPSKPLITVGSFSTEISFKNSSNSQSAIFSSSVGHPKSKPTQQLKKQDSEDTEPDNLSAYFDNDEPSHIKCDLGQRKHIDEDAVALDLTGLVSSDSTSPPIQTPPLAVPEDDIVPIPKPCQTKPIECIYKEQKRWQPSSWVPTNLYDRLAFGNGKVQALRSFFEGNQQRKQQRLTESSPDLRRKSNKLTTAEQQSVIRQLRELSDFGSQPNLVSRSVDNMTFPNPSQCKTCQHLTHQSVPDIDLECRRIQPTSSARSKPTLPNAYLIRKKANGCIGKTNNNELSQSVPELFQKPTRMVYVPSNPKLVYGSPCGSTKFLTLRKIKHAQSRKKAFSSQSIIADPSDDPR